MAPNEQYESYIKFALEEQLIKQGSSEAQQLDKVWQKCSAALKKYDSRRVSIAECEAILGYIGDMVNVGAENCINIYDVRLIDQKPACGMNWPPDLAYITPYLQLKEVTEALHINPGKSTAWVECTSKVSNEFVNVKSLPSSALLPGLLESGLRILFFNGDKDMICNHIGNEMLIENLQWSGMKGWELQSGKEGEVEKQDWIVDNDIAGYYREARNLTYVRFYNASHMVPFDWPTRSLDMLNRFMGVSLDDIHAVPFLNGSYPSHFGSPRPVSSPVPTGLSREAIQRENERIANAMDHAYFQSAGVAFLFIILGIGGWLGFQALQRRKQEWPAQNGYQDIPVNDDAAVERTGSAESVSLTAMQGNNAQTRDAADIDDLEAAFESPPSSRPTTATSSRAESRH